MPVDLAESRIDHRAPRYQQMLEQLQGNILKGHGRDHSVHLFLHFTVGPAAARHWVRQFAARYVTSAKQQLAEAEEFRRYGIPGRLFANLYLSATGYEALGFSRAAVNARFDERPAVIDGREVVSLSFRQGMEASWQELNDPPPQTWEAAYRGRRIHAMVLLADDDRGFLLRQARALLPEIQAIAEVLTVERGRVLRNHKGEVIEHFGYVDGRSQPLFLRADVEAERRSGGIDRWDPSAPLGAVLVRDPFVEHVPDCFGSYLVFRKLEQNVRGFKEREAQMARALGLKGSAAKRVEALIVGRFRDGTPLTLSDTDGLSERAPNNFTYRHDADGSRCPFTAHIRKVNPRQNLTPPDPAPAADWQTHSQGQGPRRLIVRRAVTYGERQVEPKDNPRLHQLPTGGVGLLFMCFQSSLAHQFGFIQKLWANSPHFPAPDAGVDPLIGRIRPHSRSVQPRWPRQWGKPDTAPFDFGEFVTLRGGEFLFAPSLPFLKGL